MTFLDPQSPLSHAANVATHLARFRRVGAAACRRRADGEDGARTALGNDPTMPAAFLTGASLEHLARIALG